MSQIVIGEEGGGCLAFGSSRVYKHDRHLDGKFLYGSLSMATRDRQTTSFLTRMRDQNTSRDATGFKNL